MFGLGNSSYPKYCAYAKFLDCCLGELGAERIHKIGLGDELCGQEQSFRKWSVSVYKVFTVYCILIFHCLNVVCAKRQLLKSLK